MEFAQIIGGVVVNLISLDDETIDFTDMDAAGQEFFSALGLEGDFLAHSTTGEFRGKCAMVGDMYDPEADEFVSVSVEV